MTFTPGSELNKDDLTQKDIDEYNKRREEEYNDANNPQDPNDLEEELKKQNDPDPSQGVASPDYSLDAFLYSTVMPKISGVTSIGGFFNQLRKKVLNPSTVLQLQDDEQPSLPSVTTGTQYNTLLDFYGGSISPDQKNVLSGITNMIKGSSDPTGAGSERFLFGEDVFGNLPEANRKALAKLGITSNESKLLINRYNKIGRDSAGAVESVFTTYYDFEKTKSDVFPFFAKEMKNVTQTQTPQLDHVAQLVASLGFFDGQPVKYWPEIAKIVVNEGVFGLGHDPKNLKYLAFDVHTVKSNFWRDNIGDAGEKFFKGRDLSTLPKLKAAAKEYAAIIRRSNN